MYRACTSSSTRARNTTHSPNGPPPCSVRRVLGLNAHCLSAYPVCNIPKSRSSPNTTLIPAWARSQPHVAVGRRQRRNCKVLIDVVRPWTHLDTCSLQNLVLLTKRTMSIIIQPATVQDAPAMHDVGFAAFKNDVHMNAMFRYNTASPEQLEEYRKWRTASTIARMSGPGKYWLKAVDSTSGAIAGFVGVCGPEFHVAGPEAKEGVEPPPEYINHQLQQDFIPTLQKAMEETMGERKDYWCKPAAQSPSVSSNLLTKHQW